MHLDIYQCDRKQCKEEKPAIFAPEHNSVRPPNGWFSVTNWFHNTELHFCSIRCLENWARQERKETRDGDSQAPNQD